MRKSNLIREALGVGGFLMLNNRVRYALGNNTAIVLSVVVSWYNTFKEKDILDPDGSFYFTAEKGMKEANVGRKVWDSSLKKLISLGIFQTKLKGLPAKKYFYVDFDALENFIIGCSEDIALEVARDKITAEKQEEPLKDKLEEITPEAPLSLSPGKDSSLYSRDNVLYSNTKESNTRENNTKVTPNSKELVVTSDQQTFFESEQVNALKKEEEEIKSEQVKKTKRKTAAPAKSVRPLWDQFPEFDSFVKQFQETPPPSVPPYIDLRHYYSAMETYSNKGNWYLDWFRTFITWVGKDLKAGTLKINYSKKAAYEAKKVSSGVTPPKKGESSTSAKKAGANELDFDNNEREIDNYGNSELEI